MLQAIARVNRLAEGKEFGYIVDYRGVLGELNEAMNLYDALAELRRGGHRRHLRRRERRDRQAAPAPLGPVGRLRVGGQQEGPGSHGALPGTGGSPPALLRGPDRLCPFPAVALASVQFYEETPEARINRYKDDLKYFDRLRSAIKLRYAESVDYREYEEKVRKLMDQHVRATGVSTITPMVDVFDVEAFDAEVEKLGTPTAKADTILNRMKRTITERIDEDPAYFRRFSEMVEETILAYKQGRIDQLEYLRQAESHLDAMRSGRSDGLPSQLTRYQHAPAYYGVMRESLAPYGVDENSIADLSIRQESIIEAHKVTDLGKQS